VSYITVSCKEPQFGLSLQVIFLQKNLTMNGYDVEKDLAIFAFVCVISLYSPNPRGPRGLFFAKARALLAKET